MTNCVISIAQKLKKDKKGQFQIAVVLMIFIVAFAYGALCLNIVKDSHTFSQKALERKSAYYLAYSGTERFLHDSTLWTVGAATDTLDIPDASGTVTVGTYIINVQQFIPNVFSVTSTGITPKGAQKTITMSIDALMGTILSWDE